MSSRPAHRGSRRAWAAWDGAGRHFRHCDLGGLGIVLVDAVAMNAETTLPAFAGMRERVAHEVHAACQPALSTLVTVAVMLSCASDTTSLIRRRPRRKFAQEVGLGRTNVHARTSRRPSLLTPTPTITATETKRPCWRLLHVGGVDLQYGQSPSIGCARNAFTLVVDLGA